MRAGKAVVVDDADEANDTEDSEDISEDEICLGRVDRSLRGIMDSAWTGAYSAVRVAKGDERLRSTKVS